MKTTLLNSLIKTLSIGALVTVMLISFQSCAKKAIFLGSTVVPAAEGEVTIKQDKDNNYLIKLQIENLAPVDRLQPPKNSYVIWMESDRGETKNIGQISSSNRLKVSYETISTLKPTRIFITAEEDGGVQYPGSMVILTTDIINN